MTRVGETISLNNKHERNVYNAAVMLSKRLVLENCIKRCVSAFGKVSEPRIREIAEAVYGNRQ